MPLAREVLEQIIAKTDGVPLFVEELTKTILESGLIVETEDSYRVSGSLPELAIPATLQDSLMARLDGAASMREVAQVGACIGRRFSRELLAAALPLDETTLNAALRHLETAGLLFRTGTAKSVSYAFKHALVQDTAYNSLLKSKRKHFHAHIAEFLSKSGDVVASAPKCSRITIWKRGSLNERHITGARQLNAPGHVTPIRRRSRTAGKD